MTPLLLLLYTNQIIIMIYHEYFFILFNCKIIKVFLYYYSLEKHFRLLCFVFAFMIL